LKVLDLGQHRFNVGLLDFLFAKLAAGRSRHLRDLRVGWRQECCSEHAELSVTFAQRSVRNVAHTIDASNA